MIQPKITRTFPPTRPIIPNCGFLVVGSVGKPPTVCDTYALSFDIGLLWEVARSVKFTEQRAFRDLQMMLKTPSFFLNFSNPADGWSCCLFVISRRAMLAERVFIVITTALFVHSVRKVGEDGLEAKTPRRWNRRIARQKDGALECDSECHDFDLQTLTWWNTKWPPPEIFFFYAGIYFTRMAR